MKDNEKIKFINHDLNNHLAIALGYFELLMDKNPELKNNPYVSHIFNGLARTQEISVDIANVCKDHNPEEKEVLKEGFILANVQEYISNAKPAYKKLMDIYDININLKCTEIHEPKTVYIKPSKLLSLRENIVSNALAAGATNLDVHFEMKEYCFIATYKDNGKGMLQEELDKIMLGKHGDGIVHGLGSKSILETAKDHGYSIDYSSSIGKGTTIRVLVPYNEPA